MPVPNSPRSRTGACDLATTAILSRSELIDLLSPTIPPARVVPGCRFEIRQLLLQPMAFGDQPLAVAGDDAVKLDRLTDEIGDHRQKAHVGVEPEHRLTIPNAIDRQRADHLGVRPNRHADERHRRSILALERLHVVGLE